MGEIVATPYDIRRRRGNPYFYGFGGDGHGKNCSHWNNWLASSSVVAGMNPLLAYLLPDPENSTPTRAVLVVGYLAAAFLWVRIGRQARAGASDSGVRWWFVGAVLLLLLALNKAFNLRLQFEAGIRAIAKAQGWWERRQKMQFVVAIVLPAVLAIVTTIFLAVKARGFLRRNLLALAGWVLLLLYLAVRQTQEWKPAFRWLNSIHYRDWRLALEVAGMALVVLAALRGRERPQMSSST